MSKKSKKPKNKKKGFTLVELLAVIIILAIVVGITIPAILTTTNNARKKAFQTAADSMANWIDRQYSVYKSGLDGTGLATLDSVFKSTCIRTCYNTNCPGGIQFNNKNDFYNSNDKDSNGISSKCNCNCDNRVTFLTEELVVAAGLKSENIDFNRSTDEELDSNNGIRINFTDNKMLRRNLTEGTQAQNVISMMSKVYINPKTGKSCVTLKASSTGDYPSGKISCGGLCYSGSTKRRPDYCKSTY